MAVTRIEIVRRGLAGRCPNCGERTLFPPGSFRIHPRCPHCGVALDRGEGFFLGAWVMNYGVTVFGLVLPTILLGVAGVLSWTVTLVVAIVACFALPVLFYRASWSWWLMVYFYFLPEQLPANGGRDADDE